MKIRSQIALLVGGVAVPLIVLATIVTAVLIQRERAAVESGLRDTVRALSLALDRELVNTTATLRAVAASVASERGDVRVFRDEAVRVFESQQPDWVTLLVVDPSGRIIIDARGPMSSEGGPDQWIDLHPGETRGPVIGDVRRDPRSQEYGFPIAVPVSADSPGRYVLVAVVRPSTIERMLTAQRFENIPMMGVFDGSARLVARHGVAEQGTGQPVGPLMRSMLERHAMEQLVRGTNREGVAVYTAFRRSGVSNWGVAVGVPAVAIEAGPRRVLWTVGIVGLALIAVSVAIAAVAGLSIQGDVTDLARGATQLGQGQRPEATRSHLSEVRSVNSALIAAADTIQERSEAARAAQMQAERANRAKDEFLAMLGHELRNPLGAIAGAVTLLDVAKADQPTTEQAHGVIRRQSQHLARLVDDLLEVSRVTSGRVALVRQPVDLGEVVTRAVGMWRSAGRFDEHQLSLETESVWVDGDETRLEQILSNLVGNALKYTPAPGTVSIRVSVRGDVAVLEVADTGVGIPPSLLERIFDLFVQGDRTLDRAEGGLGIGLTVVKVLVEMHGGRVGARSDGAGKGAVFTIWMPRLPDGSHRRRVVDSRSAARPEARRILIIEDNADMREVLRVQLSLEGHEVQVAADGEAGVALATTSAPDVVLVDIGLPGLDGYGVAREIRAGTDGATPLLIAVTGYGQAADRVRAVEAGYDAHVTKPVTLEHLAELIARGRHAPEAVEDEHGV